MTTCSTYNNGATSLTKARLQVARHEGHAITEIDEEDELIFEALTCQQRRSLLHAFLPGERYNQKLGNRCYGHQL